MNFLKKILVGLISLLLIGLVIFNFRLYYQPSFVKGTTNEWNKDVAQQLTHLKGKLHKGAAKEMQRVYPEGFVFLTALYGISWIEFTAALSPEDELYAKAWTEIDWTNQQLQSERAKGPFQKSLSLEYGIFYRGWSNYVLAKKIQLLASEDRDSSDVSLFQKNCTDIITALKKLESPFLESYRHACWPADMMVGMASVAIYNKLYPGKYENTLANWLKNVEDRTDELGLIPHSSRWPIGEVSEPARGSSQSLILNFLFEIDSAYAKKKFAIYHEYFLDYRLGLPGIREYPLGQSGGSDIDSGPVIWDIGGSASIVGQRAMALYGEDEVAIGLRNSIETFGMGMTLNGKKRYLFGVLPMADAFIVWSNAVEASKSDRLVATYNWRKNIQLISLVILILASLSIFFLKKSKT